MSEAGRYFSGNHEKSQQEIYQIVPGVLIEVLDLIPELEGFSIGGSYAAGTYEVGDDVDVDLLFATYPSINRLDEIRWVLRQLGDEHGIQIDVRAPLASNLIPTSFAKGTYRSGTPYVVRSPQVATYWGLEE